MGLFKRIFGMQYGPYITTETVYSNYRDLMLNVSAAKLYKTQPHLRTVISFLSDNIAQLPLKCYIKGEDGDRSRDTTGVAARLLAQPNENQTGFELIQQTVSEYKLYGEAFWYVHLDAESATGWAIHLLPNRWISQRNKKDAFSYKDIVLYSKHEPISIPSRNLIIFKNWNPSDAAAGSSPVIALKEILAEQMAAWDFRRAIWQRRGFFQEYIKRPKDVAPLDDARVDRFRRLFTSAWFNGGKDSGGMPMLEDGMEIAQAQFNAREAQWLEVAKLSLETVAAVYHVNPAMVGSIEGQTYASVKENARSLYVDTLGPDIKMIADRINIFLLPLIGAPDNEYVEFDINVKLAGSFEEQMQMFTSATGAPWMLRSEARERMNLPRILGADQLIVPLNVLEGGLASPRDTAQTSGPALEKSADAAARVKMDSSVKDEHIESLEDVVRAFFKRQRRSILSALGTSGKAIENPDWWNASRWDSELADDMHGPVLEAIRAKVRELLEESTGMTFDEAIIENFVRKFIARRAAAINNVTRDEIIVALQEEFPNEDVMSTPAGVFDNAEKNRSRDISKTVLTGIVAWLLQEFVAQNMNKRPGLVRIVKATKTWLALGPNPRPSHARMDGETVDIKSHFSNGAMWPGDMSLPAQETVNCNCGMLIEYVATKED